MLPLVDAQWCDFSRQSTYLLPSSRFQLNVTAGSQNRAIRAINEPEGRDESRFALKIKKKFRLELQVTIVRYILSLFGQIVSLFGQPDCLGLFSLC
jgi:hypothetical protein